MKSEFIQTKFIHENCITNIAYNPASFLKKKPKINERIPMLKITYELKFVNRVTIFSNEFYYYELYCKLFYEFV